MESLYIDLQLCTSVGEFSEDFNFQQLEFEITTTKSGWYVISDATEPADKKWPFATKKWNSFAGMIRHFTANCGTPIYAKPQAVTL